MTRAWRYVLDHYLLLAVGALIALVWANTSAVSYFRTSQALTFLVNDVGMAFALAYVAQELLEATLPGGTLHPWPRLLVPAIGAIGGTLGAAAVYLAYIHVAAEEVLARGWPIVCASDLLFVVAVARRIFSRGPAVEVALLAAIASDVIGLAVVSRPPMAAAAHPSGLLLIVGAVAVAAALRQLAIRSVWAHLCLAGPLSWLGCVWSGLHPALALLPLVPFLSRSPRDLTIPAGDVRRSHRANAHFEYLFAYPVQAVALLFGVVNAGVLIRGFGTGTRAVLAASLIGRPVGALCAVGVAVMTGLPPPRNLGWRELIVVALVTAPCLTFGLFIAASVFPEGPLLIETRIGALATVAAAVPALVAARLLRVGRFAGVAERHGGVETPATEGRI